MSYTTARKMRPSCSRCRGAGRGGWARRSRSESPSGPSGPSCAEGPLPEPLAQPQRRGVLRPPLGEPALAVVRRGRALTPPLVSRLVGQEEAGQVAEVRGILGERAPAQQPAGAPEGRRGPGGLWPPGVSPSATTRPRSGRAAGRTSRRRRPASPGRRASGRGSRRASACRRSRGRPARPPAAGPRRRAAPRSRSELAGCSRRYSARVRPPSVRSETSSPRSLASQPAGDSILTRAVAKSSFGGRGYHAVRFE